MLVRSKNIFVLIMILLMAFGTEILAETSETVDECLVLKLPRNRSFSIIPQDPIEEQLVKDNFVTPLEGAEVTLPNGETGTWEKAQTDSTGWFGGRQFRGAYAYVSISSDIEKLVLLEGMSHNMVYVNGEPRIGNRYQRKEDYAGWEAKFNFSLLPVKLKAGKNELLFRCYRGRLKVNIHQPDSEILFNIKDPTLPDLIVGQKTDEYGAIILVNGSDKPLEGAVLKSADGIVPDTEIPFMLPLSIRKIGFKIQSAAPTKKGARDVALKLVKEGNELASTSIKLQIKEAHENQKHTFISKVDGSVQYYSINPARNDDGNPKALFLSLHGADVEAINQSASYYPKTWGHIVSPTNRRPYGFNWEDWGRTDALEVFDIATSKLNIDPDRVYLTGHSMGGHGTWHVGATFPDKFAAIGPSAGWISFWSYRVMDQFEKGSPMEKMLLRASLPSSTFDLVKNYNQSGVYIIHGAADDNVPAKQAHMMIDHLKEAHKDYDFHEQPDAGHWWDVSDEAGTDCVDWAPLFDFFARHAVPGKDKVRHVNFTTASPGVSANNNWACIAAQNDLYQLSNVDIRIDPVKRRFVGSTKNVARLALEVGQMSPGDTISAQLDGQIVGNIPWPNDGIRIFLEQQDSSWQVTSAWPKSEKGPHRYGTFKDAVNNNVQFVYATGGNDAENKWALDKVRYDAETFWYQGNGSIDIIADVNFDPKAEPDRNVILFGNSKTNKAWKMLLKNSPVQVDKESVTIGNKKYSGDNLSCLFIRPRPGSDIASVGVVGGTGIEGLRLTNNRPYLYPGRAVPDVVVFSSKALSGDSSAVKAAGFFGLDWAIKSGDFVYTD